MKVENIEKANVLFGHYENLSNKHANLQSLIGVLAAQKTEEVVIKVVDDSLSREIPICRIGLCTLLQNKANDLVSEINKVGVEIEKL